MPQESPASPLAQWYVISLRPQNLHAGVRKAASALGARCFAMSPLRLRQLDAGKDLAQALACPRILATSPAAVRMAHAQHPLDNAKDKTWLTVGRGSAPVPQAVELLARAILIAMGQRKGAVTTAIMRRLISWLELDIDRNKKHLALAQFHANAVGEGVQVLAEWAASGKPFGIYPASALAEMLLRSKKVLSLNRPPAYHKVEFTFRLLWEAARIIVTMR